MAWLKQRLDAMPEEDRVAAQIASIPLDNGQRFRVNPKLKAAIAKCLAAGFPRDVIVESAEEFASTISPKDALPELTLADNLEMVTTTRVAAEIREAEQRDAAIAFLKHVLAGGPLPDYEVQKRASQQGISGSAIRSAQVELGITQSFSGCSWRWALPMAA